jgi:hypothetical protein
MSAITTAVEKARADERAAIVAWLRADAAKAAKALSYLDRQDPLIWHAMADAMRSELAAERIERGAHLTTHQGE